MVAVQATATSNLTASEKTEISAIKKAEEDKLAGIEERNAEFWASDLGQRKLKEMNTPKITLSK